jgi:hypothetical protein
MERRHLFVVLLCLLWPYCEEDTPSEDPVREETAGVEGVIRKVPSDLWVSGKELQSHLRRELLELEDSWSWTRNFRQLKCRLLFCDDLLHELKCTELGDRKVEVDYRELQRRLRGLTTTGEVGVELTLVVELLTEAAFHN